MPRITISFDSDQDEWVDTLASDLDRSKAYVVRGLVDAARGESSPECTDVVRVGELFTEVNTTAVNDGELVNRVDELEERVSTLEDHPESGEPRELPSMTPNTGRDPQGQSGGDTDTTPKDPGDASSAAVQWLRDRDEPANRSEIVDEWYPENAPIKAKTWWVNRTRPLLEEAGAEYTRNVGWTLSKKTSHRGER